PGLLQIRFPPLLSAPEFLQLDLLGGLLRTFRRCRRLGRAAGQDTGVASPRPLDDMGGIEALPTQYRAFLAVGGVLVFGEHGQLVLRVEHPPSRTRRRGETANRWDATPATSGAPPQPVTEALISPPSRSNWSGARC